MRELTPILVKEEIKKEKEVVMNLQGYNVIACAPNESLCI